jgi:SAM-dependent methyltransferase
VSLGRLAGANSFKGTDQRSDMVVREDHGLDERVGPYLDRLSAGDEVDALRDALGDARRDVHQVAVLGGGHVPSVEALGATVDVVVNAGGRTPRGPEQVPRARAPISAMPLASGTLDAAVVPALHAAGPVDGLFEEAARTLRPGGVLVVRSADPSTLQGRSLRAVEFLLGGTATFLTPGEVVTRAEAAGLDAQVTERDWRYTVAAVAPGRSARS